jgi:nucleoside-diphosphate-sugar epimerase
MRVLITGATGFIGRHAVRAMATAGHEVTALVRPASNREGLTGIAFAEGDLQSPAGLVDACRGMDAVVHAAAVVQGHGRWADFQPGVDGTACLLSAMREARVRRLVHLSSLGVYGMAPAVQPVTESAPLCDRPEGWNHYVRQKVLCERLVWKAAVAREIEPVVLRAAATLGPGDRASLPAIFGALRAGKMAILGAGSNRVPFVVVGDLAAAVVAALATSGAAGHAYNVSGETPITQTQFIEMCARVLGIPPPTRHVPVGFAKAASATAEWLHALTRRKGTPAMTRLGVAVATCDLLVDGSAASRDLSWAGRSSYEDAIRAEAEWLGLGAAT